jgi:hypothetical protein
MGATGDFSKASWIDFQEALGKLFVAPIQH